MIFANRHEAAQQLAEALSQYRGKNPLILAIPRGAVPMGKVVAEALDGELDVVLVRKLGAPGNPEFAIGAVDETGWVYLAPWAKSMGIDDDYVERLKEQELATIQARRARYTPSRPPRDPKDRIVIVIDDGLATGSTMIAALHAIRAKDPQKLVCAVPVAPPDTLEKIRPLCDELVCLHTPESFYAVGQFYVDFGEVTDEEVMELLRESPTES
ncbi:MAG TPA: phosphoribosyltransferase [Methylothermaceae bacterium]|nr:phosphoribosyltransferase [Methylothermaceae bacterium]